MAPALLSSTNIITKSSILLCFVVSFCTSSSTSRLLVPSLAHAHADHEMVRDASSFHSLASSSASSSTFIASVYMLNGINRCSSSSSADAIVQGNSTTCNTTINSSLAVTVTCYAGGWWHAVISPACGAVSTSSRPYCTLQGRNTNNSHPICVACPSASNSIAISVQCSTTPATTVCPRGYGVSIPAPSPSGSVTVECIQCWYGWYGDGTTPCQSCPSYVYSRSKTGSTTYKSKVTMVPGSQFLYHCVQPYSYSFEVPIAIGFVTSILFFVLLCGCRLTCSATGSDRSAFTLATCVGYTVVVSSFDFALGVMLTYQFPASLNERMDVIENQTAYNLGIAVLVVESTGLFLHIGIVLCRKEYMACWIWMIGFIRSAFMFIVYAIILFQLGIPTSIPQYNSQTGEYLGSYPTNSRALVTPEAYTSAFVYTTVLLFLYLVSFCCQISSSRQVDQTLSSDSSSSSSSSSSTTTGEITLATTTTATTTSTTTDAPPSPTPAASFSQSAGAVAQWQGAKSWKKLQDDAPPPLPISEPQVGTEMEVQTEMAVAVATATTTTASVEFSSTPNATVIPYG